MARRRENHEGSLYRRKDGRWCAQVSIQGRRPTKYAGTQSESRDWIREMHRKIDGGLQGLSVQPGNLTLKRGVQVETAACMTGFPADFAVSAEGGTLWVSHPRLGIIAYTRE